VTIDFILDEARLEAFAATLRGKLLRPGDEDHEQARKVWNVRRLASRPPVATFPAPASLALKDTYDPTTFFRLNANIRSSVRE
jgi:hypothetical protein